jgi:hypothetical protein
VTWKGELDSLCLKLIYHSLKKRKKFQHSYCRHATQLKIVSFSTLLSTDQEMSPARNAYEAHAQYFLANDEHLLPMLKTLAQYTCWIHATRNDGCFQPACLSSSRTVCRSVACTSSSPVVRPTEKQSHPQRQTLLNPARIISCSAVISMNNITKNELCWRHAYNRH